MNQSTPAPMQWFRAYSFAAHDPKIQMLPIELRWHWFEILCMSSENTERGIVPDTPTLSWVMRLSEEEVSGVLEGLHKAGLLDVMPDGRYSPHNWSGRQRESDNVTARVQKHRSNHRENAGDSGESGGGNNGIQAVLSTNGLVSHVDTGNVSHTGECNVSCNVTGNVPSRMREEQSQSRDRVREEQSTLQSESESKALSSQAPTALAESDLVTEEHSPSSPAEKKPAPKAKAGDASLKPDSPGMQVFNAWCDSIREHRGSRGGSEFKLDEKRKKSISFALKLYPLEDIVDAVHGWRRDPFSRGENDRGTAYSELTLLLRDAAHIEKFRDLERKHRESLAPPAPKPPPKPFNFEEGFRNMMLCDIPGHHNRRQAARENQEPQA